MKQMAKHVRGFVVLALASACTYIKIPLGLGMLSLVFSAFVVIPPFLALFLPSSFLYASLGALVCARVLGFSPLLAAGIPTFASVLAWKYSDETTPLFHKFLLFTLVPLLCMMFFIAHPVGSHVFAYSFYWFIPMFGIFASRMNAPARLITIALASTFLAHAIGSVVWLYSIPSTPAYWLTLIPVVAVERIVFAGGMLVVYGLCACARRLYLHDTGRKVY